MAVSDSPVRFERFYGRYPRSGCVSDRVEFTGGRWLGAGFLFRHQHVAGSVPLCDRSVQAEILEMHIIRTPGSGQGGYQRPGNPVPEGAQI